MYIVVQNACIQLSKLSNYTMPYVFFISTKSLYIKQLDIMGGEERKRRQS